MEDKEATMKIMDKKVNGNIRLILTSQSGKIYELYDVDYIGDAIKALDDDELKELFDSVVENDV